MAHRYTTSTFHLHYYRHHHHHLDRHVIGWQETKVQSALADREQYPTALPFGNYVVQYILDLGLPWANAEVMIRLAGNYAELSMQKFSSNVVEKCLKLADASLEEHRNVVVREIMTSPLLVGTDE